MTLCDTGPLVAIGNRNDPEHARCLVAAATLPRGPLLTTWSCCAEAMHLASRMGGHLEQTKLWRLRHAGRLILHDSTPAEVDRMAVLMDLADASLVAAAEQLGLRRIFTLDRHFYAYRLADGSAMTVVP